MVEINCPREHAFFIPHFGEAAREERDEFLDIRRREVGRVQFEFIHVARSW